MFRTLAMRLTAAYVSAAFGLVVVVIAAVTAFALSTFAIGARESSDGVARQVPDDVRLAVGRYGSLERAAPDIAEHLVRPGLRIGVFARYGNRVRPLAFARADISEGRPIVFTMSPEGPLGHGSHGAVALPFGEPPPGEGTLGRGPPAGRPPFEMFRPFPFGLNAFMHLEPKRVDIAGGRIVIVPDPQPLAHAVDEFWLAMVPIGIFVIAAAWFLGRAITGQALRPLVETTASLRRFGEGDFTPRPIVTADRNEIGELVAAYNAAAAQVGAAFEERRAAERQMRQFIADAGHELRTPLTVVMGFIDVLRKRAQHGPAGSLKIYDTMLVESRRMKALIEKLIVLARLENARPHELETVDLSALTAQVVTTLQALTSQPRIVLHDEPGAFVRGDEHELHDAISNLIENGLKYAPESPIDVRVWTEGNVANLEVADCGPGIPSDEHERIFARFYRGRERADTEGFGLGLAIAECAVGRAGGTIRLESRLGEGSRFTIALPCAARGESVPLAV